jgi:hypothetical protein
MRMGLGEDQIEYVSKQQRIPKKILHTKVEGK